MTAWLRYTHRCQRSRPACDGGGASRLCTRSSALGRDETGAVLVEFTIILVPFILLTFGTIEYGRLAWVREEMSEVAIAAARCMGVLQPACAEGGQYSQEKTLAFVSAMARARSVSLGPNDVALDRDASCAGLAGFSEVRIDFSFVSAVPMVMKLISGGLPLGASACFPNQDNGS